MASDGPKNLYEAHEERLLRVEQGFQEVSTQLVKNTVSVEYLGQKLEDGVANIAEKIDNTFKPLANGIRDKINSFEPRIDHLEFTEKSRTERRILIYKIAGPLTAAGIGWIIHMLWDLIKGHS